MAEWRETGKPRDRTGAGEASPPRAAGRGTGREQERLQ